MSSTPISPKPERKRIAVRVPEWCNYGPQITRGMLKFIRAHEDCDWAIEYPNHSFGEMEQIQIDETWQGDALVLFRATAEELEVYKQRGQAVALVSSEGPSGGFPRIIPDNFRVGGMAAEHLMESMVPNLAFLARGETLYQEANFAPGQRVYPRERLKGFIDKLQESDITPSVHYISGHPLWKKNAWKLIEKEVSEFIESLPKPCGLFVADDPLAGVVVKVAAKMQIDIPGELLVIGFGNDPGYCLTANTPLSSIGYPGSKVGYAAAEAIQKQLLGEAPQETIQRIEVRKLRVRESSDSIAIPDPDFAKLVRWMRLRAIREPLRMDDLVEKSGLSISSLRKRFHQFLGHSPKEELAQIRLKHFKHLLARTEEPVAVISEKMGFLSIQEASRFFMREAGQRPTEYREQNLVDNS
ncbi:DNA-binding transcriptional regulator, LacI/PurR family [Rubritalea squalenifaciens DSM 18772]|uniref:DNA-binding transcriptional regulator, LacI/PurR family n=1 Tax=Rubritalea squalenifaciens DSM 18772 TaxID=1123071 RepID=A0A1M6BHH5_9BACT|nr:substrate-binding domain-containing protein [Rubritalea squalenifaciens]SHI47923.1 DNA-binding transcriptional regulator, LacI/PurR family [Rubritalea squalenifaciens DSM 18772]